MIGDTEEEFGGSELQKLMYGKIFGKSPALDLEVEQKRQESLLNAIRKGYVASAHDIAEGGLAVAMAESSFGTNGLGATIRIGSNLTAELFSETQSRFIVSVKQEYQEAFEAAVADALMIGEVNESAYLKMVDQDGKVVLLSAVEELETAWKGAIPCLLKSKA